MNGRDGCWDSAAVDGKGRQDSEVKEFFLPRDFGEQCVGCTVCFEETESKCPHYTRLAPLTEALDEADVIILASPVYVYHVTGR